MDRELAQSAAFQRLDQRGPTDPRIAITDLSSIRSDLEGLLRRAGDVASGVHSIADAIVGPRPENGSGAGAPQSIQPSLAEMIEDLGRAISRAESGLTRF